MTRPANIETLLEEAFVDALTTYANDDVTVTRWDDIKDKDLMPMIKVKASTASEVPGTLNLFIATSMIVDFGIFTSKREDEDGRYAMEILGDVRALLSQSDIVTTLNIKPGLAVYNRGVLPQGSFEVEDAKNWHKGITVTVMATTKEIA